MNNAALGTTTISFVKMFAALAFVLGLIFLSAYLFRKISGSRFFAGKNRVAIQTLGSLALGDKRLLVVVAVEGQNYFLGVTNHAINLLARLDQPVAPSGESFQAVLDTLKDRSGSPA
jgi:flagellar protein FliO/FliZ